MAFPTVASLTETTVASMTTTHNISLGATVNAGDLLLIAFVGSQVGADQLYTITKPTGFKRLWDRQFDLASQNRQHVAIFAKKAIGDEDGTSVNVATSASVSAVGHVYRIDAGSWSGDLRGIACSVYTQAEAANPNPASLTVPWGSADNLWLAIATWEDSDFFASAAPTNYTNLTTEIADSTEDAVISSARRENAVATEDPGTFTAASEKYLALTIGIAPAGATLPTFPVIPTVADGRILFQNNTAGGATKTFPSLSNLNKSEDDLLIAIVVEYDGNSTNAEFSAWGAGFTERADRAGTATMAIGVADKISTGAETGTFTVTTADTSTNDSVMILLSIAGADPATPIEVSTMTTGTTSAADFDSLTVSWGAEDNLWIYVAAAGETATGGSFTGVSAIGSSTGYAESGITADVVGGVEAAVAFSPENTATQDNATATVDTSNARNAALTIGVRPVPGTPPPTEIDSVPGVAIALAVPQLVEVGLTVFSRQAHVIALAVAPEITVGAGATEIASVPGFAIGVGTPPDVSAILDIHSLPGIAVGLSALSTVAEGVTIAPNPAFGIVTASPPSATTALVSSIDAIPGFVIGLAISPAVTVEVNVSIASRPGLAVALVLSPNVTTGTGVSGSGAMTQDPDTMTGSGQLGTSGIGAGAQDDNVMAGVGQVGVQGSGSFVQGDDVMAGSGIISVSEITGSGAMLQADQVMVGAGNFYTRVVDGGKVGTPVGSPRVTDLETGPASVGSDIDELPGHVRGGTGIPKVGTE